MAKKVYLAGPLFTMAEIEFNLKLYDFLSDKDLDIFLPQKECQGMSLEDIFETCKTGVDQADIVLAVLDGPDADSGTCWECGYAYARGKKIIGLRTDFRISGDTRGFNAMLYFSATTILECSGDYLSQIYKAISLI